MLQYVSALIECSNDAMVDRSDEHVRLMYELFEMWPAAKLVMKLQDFELIAT